MDNDAKCLLAAVLVVLIFVFVFSAACGRKRLYRRDGFRGVYSHGGNEAMRQCMIGSDDPRYQFNACSWV